MRMTLGLIMAFCAVVLAAQDKDKPEAATPPNGVRVTVEAPSDPKAQKTFKEAMDYLKRHDVASAVDSLKRADKQDGQRCLSCQKMMIKYGIELRDWKTAEQGASEMVAEAAPGQELALAHQQMGILLLQEGIQRHKDELFGRAHEEMTKALEAYPKFPAAVYGDGIALAHMKQDDAAKAQFERFVAMRTQDDPDRQRALRFISNPELARARMAPAFAVTTIDGQHVSLDDLKGKVVLLDFWATWCGPCRAALPHMKSIAKKFEGQPLVILSVSLDRDENSWKEFIAKNEMTWLHYRDGGFDGPIAKLFAVEAIPHTFTIDADGILQDEKIGDASIEGKLKKLLARARELSQGDQKSP